MGATWLGKVGAGVWGVGGGGELFNIKVTA